MANPFGGTPLPPPQPQPPSPPPEDQSEVFDTLDAARFVADPAEDLRPPERKGPLPRDWKEVIGFEENTDKHFHAEAPTPDKALKDAPAERDEEGESSEAEEEEEEDDREATAAAEEACLRNCQCTLMAAQPGLCALIWFLLVLGACVVIVAFPPSLDTSFEAFLKVDVNSSIKLDNFDIARDAREQGTTGRRLAQAYLERDLEIGYRLREGKSLQNSLNHIRALSEISEFERRLLGKAEWQKLCMQSIVGDQLMCDPGYSFTYFAKPSQDIPNTKGDVLPTKLLLDGQQGKALPFHAARMLMEQYQGFTSNAPAELLLPSGMDSAETTDVTNLRSFFRFRFPCCTPGNLSQSYWEDEWETFVKDVLLPEFDSCIITTDGDCDSYVEAFLDGTSITDIVLEQTLLKDILWAIASLLFVLLYLIVHTQSLLLSVAGPIVAATSLPLAYVTTAVLADVTTISFASFLALFLTIGIGADVIFVYTDFWRSSAKSHKSTMNHASRLTWTYWHAGIASFATTGITALSFLANLASAIRALRQFGFFMGLCILYTWLLISLIYVPLLLVDELWLPPMCGLLSFVNKKKKSSHGRQQPEQGKARARSLASMVPALSVTCVHKLRCLWAMLTFVATVTVSVWLAMEWEVDFSAPDLFPESHSQSQGEKVLDVFENVGTQIPSVGTDVEVCPSQESNVGQTLWDFSSTDVSNWDSNYQCEALWCESEYVYNDSSIFGDDSMCQCWRQDKSSLSCDGMADVRINRMASSTNVISEARVRTYLTVPTTATITRSGGEVNVLGEEWLSGDIHYWTTEHLQVDITSNTGNLGTCGWKDVCFCGGNLACKRPTGWYTVADQLELLPAASSRRLLAPRRRLTVPPVGQRAKVWVVFGLNVKDTMPLLKEPDPGTVWNYVDEFDPSIAETQRNLRDFCTGVAAREEELRVLHTWCWIEGFKDYVADNPDPSIENPRFPRFSDFHELAVQYADSPRGVGGNYQGRYYLWIENVNVGAQVQEQVKAMYFTFELDVAKDDDSVAQDLKDKWDRYVQDWNNRAQNVAEGMGAFTLSELWVTAEGNTALYRSILWTIGMLFVGAFFGVLIFTRSFILSTYVVISTAVVVVALAFIVVVVLRWPFGLIEVIAIIYFIGYALTYSLHVAHKYAVSRDTLRDEPRPKKMHSRLHAERYRRTSYALKSIGGAALGSAVTTAGASLFLVFCTLTLFTKLGIMCLLTTVLSIYVALVPLPACLMICGPQMPGCLDRLWLNLQSQFVRGMPKAGVGAPEDGPPGDMHY